MGMSKDQITVDREDRNSYLSNLDEVWETCCAAVESARSMYEATLDSTRATYEKEEAASSVSYATAIDDAWTAYKANIAGETPAVTRREAITAARAIYNDCATRIRLEHEEASASRRTEYLRVLHSARVDFETEVDNAMNEYRTAITGVGELFGAPLGASGDDAAGATSSGGDPAPAASSDADPTPAAGGDPTPAAGGDSSPADSSGGEPAPEPTPAREPATLSLDADEDEGTLDELAEALASRNGWSVPVEHKKKD